MAAVFTLAVGLGSVGCSTHTGNAAMIGGAGGALAGAAIGSHSHRRAGEGALLGGAIGAIGGAIVGNEMDRREREPAYDYERGGYSRGPYYDDADYYAERRSDCPPGRYEYRSYPRYGRGIRYYERTYCEY